MPAPYKKALAISDDLQTIINDEVLSSEFVLHYLETNFPCPSVTEKEEVPLSMFSAFFWS